MTKETISRVYISIEREIDSTTGWSHIERVYAAFYAGRVDLITHTSYGTPMRSDKDVLEAVQNTLEELEKEGHRVDYEDTEIRISQQTSTQIITNHWEAIGKHI